MDKIDRPCRCHKLSAQKGIQASSMTFVSHGILPEKHLGFETTDLLCARNLNSRAHIILVEVHHVVA